MKNVLITGPTRGLGLAITSRLMGDGYHVIGVARTLTDDYRRLLESDSPGCASFVQFDLAQLNGIPQLTRSITEEHGHLFALVNNAAIGSDGVLATMHASEISKMLRVNLEAPILLAKFACRSMMSKGEGRIVNIASIIATTGFNGLSVYGASKAGLIGFSRSLSREIGRLGITVNCVAPGFVSTEMTRAIEGEKLEAVRRRAPLGLAEPQDVAGAVAYLLSAEASRISGITLTVDGGSTA